MDDRIQYFAVTGVANETVLDSTGIESTEAETRHIVDVLVVCSDTIGNRLVVYYDTDKIIEVPDYLLRTYATTGAANILKNDEREVRIPINRTLERGKKLKVGVLSGGTLSSISGGYHYEVAA